NLAILVGIARWFRVRGRTAELEVIAAEAGIESACFDRLNHWVTWRQFEAVLEGARACASDEAEFIEMCRFNYAENFGWARIAITPSSLYVTAVPLSRYFSSAGRFELVRRTRNSARLRWRSHRPESRLMCLSRMATAAMAPTLWGG